MYDLIYYYYTYIEVGTQSRSGLALSRVGPTHVIVIYYYCAFL